MIELHPNYRTKKFSITIDTKYQLNQDFIQSFQLTRSVYQPHISAELIFIDHGDFLNTIPLTNKNLYEFEAVDSLGILYKEKFFPLNVQKINLNNPQTKLIKVTLMDKDSFNMMSSHFSKGFSNKTPSDMCTELLLKYLVEKVDFKIQVDPEQDKSIESYVVPSQKNVIQMLSYMGERFNFNIFQTRSNFKVSNYKQIVSEAPLYPTEYTISSANTYGSMYVILESNVKPNQAGEAAMTMPDQKILTVDITDLRIQMMNYGQSDAIKDQTPIGEEQPQLEPDFSKPTQKSVYKPVTTAKTQTRFKYSQTLNRLNEIEVLVPGHYSIDVGIRIKTNVTSAKGDQTPEQTLSGEWLVTEVRERYIQGGYIFFRLKLSRSGTIKG